jgi:hypothetical protein
MGVSKEEIINTVKTLLGIEPTNATVDPLLYGLLEQVIAEAEVLTGVVIGREEEVTERFPLRQRIFLSKKPVVTIVSAKVIGGDDITDEIVLFDKEKGVLLIPDLTSYSDEEVEIIYTAGYENIPEWLASVLVRGVLGLYGKTDALKHGATRVNTPDGTVVYSDDRILAKSDEALLKRRFIPPIIGG